MNGVMLKAEVREECIFCGEIFSLNFTDLLVKWWNSSKGTAPISMFEIELYRVNVMIIFNTQTKQRPKELPLLVVYCNQPG